MNKVSENPLKNRTEQLSPFVVVSVLFILCYVVSNLMAVKVVGFFGLFYFDAGTITFPLAYMLGDVLTEIWGVQNSQKDNHTCIPLQPVRSCMHADRSMASIA